MKKKKNHSREGICHANLSLDRSCRYRGARRYHIAHCALRTVREYIPNVTHALREDHAEYRQGSIALGDIVK